MQLPPGFTVEMKTRILNDAGEQIAELDVFIAPRLSKETDGFIVAGYRRE